MALPAAVRKQVEEAERLAFEMGMENAPKPEGVEEPDALEEEEAAPVEGHVEVADVTPEPQEEEPAPEPDPEPAVDWEHKFKVLQGKYNAEVPRLQNENAALNDRLAGVENVLASMRTAQQTEEKHREEEATQSRIDGLITPDDVEAYGSDMIDVMKRAASQIVAGELAKVRAENDELRSQMNNVQGTVAQSGVERLWQTLDNTVENWREVNNDPGFIAWLGQVDPYIGETKQTLLRRAYEQHNGKRVARFFTDYLKEHAITHGEPTSEPPAETVERVDMETLVAPKRGRQEPAPVRAQEDGSPITQAEIAAFYDECRRGRYKGREDERLKIEARIFEAGRRGLIQ